MPIDAFQNQYVMGWKLTPKQKRLAAMYGNPKKITRGDIITAAVKNKTKKKTKKQPKKQGKMVV